MSGLESKAENPAVLIAGLDVHPVIKAYFEFNHLGPIFQN